MNVSNGTSSQNTNATGGINTQQMRGVQGQQGMGNTQQGMGNTQQGMGNTQQGMGNTQQGMGNTQQVYTQQQNPNMGYQQNPNMGYQQPINMGQSTYQQSVYPMMVAKSTLGLVGLILSILSLICCGPVLAIPGLICSIIALIKNKNEKRAIIGTIIGAISMILWIILCVTGLVSINNLSLTDTHLNEHEIIEDEEDDYDVEEDDYDVEEDDYDVEEDDYDVEEDTFFNDEEDAEENNSEEVEGNVGTDVAGELTPGSVVYNGITLNAGEYTATELEGILGYTFNEDDMKYVVNPGYYTYTTYYVTKIPYCRIVYFYFVNDTEEAIPMSECKLYRVNFYCSDYFSGDILTNWCNVDFGSGITPESTAEEIINLLGEPDYFYENEEHNIYKIEYYKKFDYIYTVEFSFIDGKMYEATIGEYQ